MRLTIRIALACCAAVLILSLCGCGGGKSSPPPPPPPFLLTVTTTSLPDAVSTMTYSTALLASGGTAPYRWSWAAQSGNLPAGLTLDSSGTISGTAPATDYYAQYPLTITVTDSGTPAQSATGYFFLGVRPRLAISGSLPAGNRGVVYSGNLSTNLPVATWTVSSGALPPGLALANAWYSNVSLTGTPTQTGTFPFTLEAKESSQTSSPQTARRDFSITVNAILKIISTSLKAAVIGIPYNDTVVAVNGAPPLSWNAPQGLPTGLSIDATSGAVTGTPTQPGSSGYQITVSDSSSPPQSDSATVQFDLRSRLQISSSLLYAHAGQNAWVTLSATGGFWPYIWQASELPPGISLSGGTLAVQFPQAGTYPIAVTVQDGATPPNQASRMVNVIVAPPLLSVNYCSPPSPRVAQSFDYKLSLNQWQTGTPPYFWSVQAGSLPDGLTLDASTGEITGVPTSAGLYQFVAQVTDSASPPQRGMTNCTLDVARDVSSPGSRNDSIANATPINNGQTNASISPYANPVGTVNPDTDYYQVFATAGQTLAVSINAAYGNTIDPVLELLDADGNRLQTCRNQGTTDGLQSGTVDPTPNAFDDPCVNDDRVPGSDLSSYLELQVPGTAGTVVPVYIHVLDERGDARPDFRYYIYLSGAVPRLALGTRSLDPATVGNYAERRVFANAGTPPYSYALTSGSLPFGMTLSPDGTVKGTPSTAGRYAFTVSVADSGLPQTATGEVVFYVTNPISIDVPDPLPQAATGRPYALPIYANGGYAPTVALSWTQAPQGLVFSGGAQWVSGLLSGIPDHAGAFTGIITASASGTSVTRNITLAVNPGPFSIADQSLPDSRSSGAYSSVLTGTGGTQPFTWSVIAGNLPPGLTLDSSTGEIFGGATAAGSYTFTIQVADSGSPQQTATRTFTLNVVGP